MLGEFSMYTPKHIADASETGLSEEALRLLMEDGFLLRMDQKRQMAEAQDREDRQHRRLAALLGRKGR
jgi:hypothetical protein